MQLLISLGAILNTVISKTTSKLEEYAVELTYTF